MKEYEIVIGLEVHVELMTKSKLFCSCSTEFGAKPNSLVCPLCMGMPGALPMLNKRAVELGIAAAIVTNSKIAEKMSFDKKNYFYPDLANGYQTTQLFAPICKDGWVEIAVEGAKKRITLDRIHIEEDAGKLVHTEKHTLIDYNRCSVPLIEIVTNPDFRGADEVTSFLEKLRLLLSFAGVSDCRMQEGSMRCDVNLSVRERGSSILGVRTEMKNINSFRAIERAINYEAKRQIEIIENTEGSIIQETRRWDDELGKSLPMRKKEDASDYRYFPNADIPPVSICREWKESIRQSLPESSDDKYLRMTEKLGISFQEAKIIARSKNLSDIFDALTERGVSPRSAANWTVTELLALETEANKSSEDIKIDCDKLSALISLVEKKEINRGTGKKILELIYTQNIEPLAYVRENSLGLLKDKQEIEKIVFEVISEFPNSLQEYKLGNKKVATFFVGKIMKKTQGRADVEIVNKVLISTLEKE